MDKIIAHVDMDCFFAAVEMKMNFELRNKPVIIGYSSDRGVVCTASYEARKFGVRSAMSSKIARELCPNGIFVKPNMKLYKLFSNAIMYILSLFADDIEQVSVDEAYLDITSFAKKVGDLERVGFLITHAVYEKTGLTCSIGISKSRYVSKIASDFQKPKGVTVVVDVVSFLKELPVGKISGIGKKSQKILLGLKIKTIEDLANADPFLLLEYFGDYIIKFQNVAKGLDYTGLLKRNSKNKSISREITFEKDLNLDLVKEYIPEIINNLNKQICSNLYKTISIKIRYNNFKTISKSYSFNVHINNVDEIYNKVYSLLSQIKDNRKIRLFGIKLGSIILMKDKQKTLSCLIS